MTSAPHPQLTQVACSPQPTASAPTVMKVTQADLQVVLQPLDTTTRPVSDIIDIEALQNVLADSRQQNEVLRTDLAAAQAEAKAASDRAQVRYKDKVHANRNAERIEQALKAERMEREDEKAKAVRYFIYLKETIARLEREKNSLMQNKRQDSVIDPGSLQASEEQVAQLQSQTRTQQDGIHHLEATLAASAAEQAKQVPALELPGPDEAAAEAINAKLRQDQAQLQVDREAFERAKNDAQARFTQALKEFEQAKQDTQAKFRSDAVALQQGERQKAIALQQQLDEKTREVAWYKLQLQQQRQASTPTAPGTPRNTLGQHGTLPLTPEQKGAQHVAANKRQRINSAGASISQVPGTMQGRPHTPNTIFTPQSHSRPLQGQHPSPMPSQAHFYPAAAQHAHHLQQRAARMHSQGPHRRQPSQSSNAAAPSPSMCPTPLSQRAPGQGTPRTSAHVRPSSSQSTLAQSSHQIPQAGQIGQNMQQQQMDYTQQLRHQQRVLQQHQMNVRQPQMSSPRQQMNPRQLQMSPQQQQAAQQQQLQQWQRMQNQANAQRQQVVQQTPLQPPMELPVQYQVDASMGMQAPGRMSREELQAAMLQRNQRLQAIQLANLRNSQLAQEQQQQGVQASGQDDVQMQLLTNPFPTSSATTQNLMPQDQQQSNLAPADSQFPASESAAQSQVQPSSETTQEDMEFELLFNNLQDPMSSCSPTIMSSTDQFDIGNVVQAGQQSPYTPDLTAPNVARASRKASTPSIRRAATPNVPGRIACVNCHRNWWEDSCEGQPCTNCISEGVTCARPACANFSNCSKGRVCKLVHQNNARYHDPEYLITLNNGGAMPKRGGAKARAEMAPSLRGKRKADGISDF